MTTYAKTTDGKIHIVWSDNTEEETMNLIEERFWLPNGQYDPEFIDTKTYEYSDILITDSNLVVVKS